MKAGPVEPCANCGAAAPGNYCPACGQRTGTRRTTVRRLIQDFVDEQLSINSALPRTLAGLARPGFLTAEYMAGRVTRYVTPFRLYLTASFVFFLGLALTGGGELNVGLTSPPEPTASEPAAAPGAGAADPDDGEASGFLVAIGDALGMDVRPRLTKMAEMNREQLDAALRRDFMQRLPVAVFLLIPVVALLLKLVYVRTGRLYVEHFIFALHVHAFVFLLLTLRLPLRSIGIIAGIISIIVVVYMYAALKRYYGQGYLKTAAKYVLLAFLYLLALGAAMGATIIITLFTVPV